MLEHLTQKTIHIVGIAGAEGSAVALFLAKHVSAKQFVFHEMSEEKDFKQKFFSYHDGYSKQEKDSLFSELKKIEAQFHFKGSYLEGIDDADVIYVPQSWFRYSENDVLKNHTDKLSSLTRLYLELAKCKVIGVTGTAGKSTTTALIQAMLVEAGVNSILSGNERHLKQDVEAVSMLEENDALVLEISHRQLIVGLRKSPDIAVITNILPHHKDDSDSFEEYADVKKSIFAQQNTGQSAILNLDDELLANEQSKGVTYYFSLDEHGRDGAFVRHNELWLKKDGSEKRICDVRDVALRGEHNLRNVLAASFAAFEFGVGTKEIRRVVTTFTALHSRMEKIAEIDGVTIIDDSKGGSSPATISAIRAFAKPKVLIAGGTRKEISEDEFDSLAEAIVENNVIAVVLIGKMQYKIENAIKKMGLNRGRTVPVSKKDTLEDAVSEAFGLAQPGDVLLFSPACESFDMYSDYRERSKEFNQLISKRAT